MYSQFFTDDDLSEKSHNERVRIRNDKYFRESANAWVKMASARLARESAKHGYEFDAIEQLKKPGFSMREAAAQLGKLRLSEDVTTAMVYALANVATIASAADNYKLIPTIYRRIAKIRPSKKSEETYFALQRGDIPGPVGETEDVPESRVGGVLTRIKNYKFGRIWSVSSDALDDDQTGQLAELGQIVGESMAYAEEQWFIVTLFFAYQAANIRPAGSIGNGIIPPMCIAGQAPANYGGPTCTVGDVTIANVENLLQAADYVTDLEGNFALTAPTDFLCAGSRRMVAKKIFGSPVNPGGAATSAGAIGGAFMINPLYGELTINHTPFVNRARAGLDAATPPWAIGMAGRGASFQDRTALSVVQEAENAGKSFEQDARRTKAKRRFGCGVTEGEAWMVGN